MTGVYDTAQLVLMLAGVFGTGVAGTWAFMRAINHGRSEMRREILDAIAELRSEVKIDVERLWRHNEKIANKWDLKADKVHQRLSEHDKSVRQLSEKVIEIGVLLTARGKGTASRPPNRSGKP